MTATAPGGYALEVRGLRVIFRSTPGRPTDVLAVDGFDLHLAPGGILALVGESGSGKSATLLALAGLLPETATVEGTVLLDGTSLLELSERERARLRGRGMGMVFQDPGGSLNPVVTIGAQIDEVVTVHRGLRGRAARAETEALLARCGIGDARRRADAYAHQLSGGLRQRAAIAAALAAQPRVILADEPTTALDATVQAQILDLLTDLVDATGVALLLVTHDMAVAAAVADRIAVAYAGRIVEERGAPALMERPGHPYSHALRLAALPFVSDDARRTDRLPELPGRMAAAGGVGCAFAPRCPSRSPSAGPTTRGRARSRTGSWPAGARARSGCDPDMTELRLVGVHRRFVTSGHAARALDGVDLTVASGEIVGLVGESGCGKTTLTRIAVGLDHPDEGEVLLDGRPLTDARGRMPLSDRRRIQLVFQDAYGSFNPRRTIGRSLVRPLRRHGLLRRDARDQVAGLLEQVGLEPEIADRHPHTLSGGQLQRASIARALALGPEILVCDEPVASMDVSVRAQILNVLLDLWRDRGIGVLFVSHDLGVVRRIAGRVAVMYLGRIVETGDCEALWSKPRHPYTRSLAESMPTGAERWRDGARRPRLEGEPPSPFEIPSGCRFHPRCPIAVERCRIEDPQPRPLPPDILVACHLAE